MFNSSINNHLFNNSRVPLSEVNIDFEDSDDELFTWERTTSDRINDHGRELREGQSRSRRRVSVLEPSSSQHSASLGGDSSFEISIALVLRTSLPRALQRGLRRRTRGAAKWRSRIHRLPRRN
uniref:Uncharacterized protein n=1 Tax=Cacopsylla melanoneura TaxID=428564 RepID=A0A8D8R752_9HEMI